jgi:hypothetical protein
MVAGCSETGEMSQPTGQNTSGDAEPPAWANTGVVDVEAIHENTITEMSAGPFIFENRTFSRERTTLPISGDVLEETVVSVKSDGNQEIGLYQSATEPEGAINGGLRAASRVEERYNADGESYSYSNTGPYPSYGFSEASFEGFVSRVNEQMFLLFEGAERIEFETPVWDESNEVFLVQGAGIDDSDLDNDLELIDCEMQITEAGVFVRAGAKFAINDQRNVNIESTVTTPQEITVPEPSWVPESLGQLAVDVTIDDASWQFSYEQGVVSESELVLPANHIVKLQSTGEYNYSQTLDIPELRFKLSLLPDEKRSRELYVAEELVGNTFDIRTVEISPNYRNLDAEVRIVDEDAFDEWLAENQ